MHFCTASLFFAKQKTQHFCTAFIFCKAKNTAFCRFLTFWFAEHFPKENVQHQQNVRAASLCFCKAKNTAFLHQQNVTNHLMRCKNHFCNATQHNILFFKSKKEFFSKFIKILSIKYYSFFIIIIKYQSWSCSSTIRVCPVTCINCGSNPVNLFYSLFSLHRRTFKMAPVEASHPRVNSGSEDYREIEKFYRESSVLTPAIYHLWNHLPLYAAFLAYSSLHELVERLITRSRSPT